MFARAIGALAKTYHWTFHAKAGWAFDTWAVQNIHSMKGLAAVLAPNFQQGTVSLYLVQFRPRMFGMAAKVPPPGHEPFELTISGRTWGWMARKIDAELHAMLGIERAAGLMRAVA